MADESLYSLPGTIGDPRDASTGEKAVDTNNFYNDNIMSHNTNEYNPWMVDNYSIGPGSNNQGSYNNSLGDPGDNTSGGFLDNLWNRLKQYGYGKGVGAVVQRAGDAAPLVGPLAAGLAAPEGKGVETATRGFGSQTVNGLLMGINPALGALNYGFGALTGKTLGSWFAGPHDNPNGFNQDTAASKGGGNAQPSGVDNLLTGIAGLYSANKENRGLTDQINSLSGQFGQNGAYSQALRQQLERRDAASGRRSQYGAREVDLQAKLAEMASKNAGPIGQLVQQRNTNKVNNINSIMQLGRQSGLFDKLGGLYQQKPEYGPLSNNFMNDLGEG